VGDQRRCFSCLFNFKLHNSDGERNRLNYYEASARGDRRMVSGDGGASWSAPYDFMFEVWGR